MPEWTGTWADLAKAGFVLGWVIGGSLAAMLFIWKLFGNLLKGNGNGNGNLEARVKANEENIAEAHRRIDRVLWHLKDDE